MDKICPILATFEQIWLYLNSETKYVPYIIHQNDHWHARIQNLKFLKSNKYPICPILDKICPILVTFEQIWLYLNTKCQKSNGVLCCAAKNSIDPEYLYNLTVESIEKTSELERIENNVNEIGKV